MLNTQIYADGNTDRHGCLILNWIPAGVYPRVPSGAGMTVKCQKSNVNCQFLLFHFFYERDNLFSEQNKYKKG